MLTEKLKRYGSFGTHDALKLGAMLLMVVGHTGVFEFPHNIWLRIAGHAGPPIFFFLTGYSRSYRIRADLVLAALFLVGLKFLGAHSLTHLNILVGYILARLMLAQMEKGTGPFKYPWLVFVPLVLLWPFSTIVVEYGTLGLMLALCGYMQKHAARYSRASRIAIFVIAFLCYEARAVELFKLSESPELISLTAVLAGCGTLLWFYRQKPLALPGKWHRLEPVLAWPARYSLWIYTVHWAILQIITGEYF